MASVKGGHLEADLEASSFDNYFVPNMDPASGSDGRDKKEDGDAVNGATHDMEKLLLEKAARKKQASASTELDFDSTELTKQPVRDYYFEVPRPDAVDGNGEVIDSNNSTGDGHASPSRSESRQLVGSPSIVPQLPDFSRGDSRSNRGVGILDSPLSGGRTYSVIDTNQRFADKYVPQHMLGSGATGEVILCKHKRTGLPYACKVVEVSATTPPAEVAKFEEEINILATLNHKNIIQLKDVFQESGRVYIVMELASGGELFERILDRRTFCERDARSIIKKLFKAIAYVHSKGICHRDLKPENILFSDESNESEIKIADFGFAARLFSPMRKMRAGTKLGTLGYAAPEVFSGSEYDEKCDVWSLGVISYILLSGIPPFCDADFDNPNTPFWIHVNRMKVGKQLPKLEFPINQWKHVSDEAKNFISTVLNPNPLKRPRSRDVLSHPWLKRDKTLMPAKHMNATLKYMRQFNATLKREIQQEKQLQGVPRRPLAVPQPGELRSVTPPAASSDAAAAPSSSTDAAAAPRVRVTVATCGQEDMPDDYVPTELVTVVEAPSSNAIVVPKPKHARSRSHDEASGEESEKLRASPQPPQGKTKRISLMPSSESNTSLPDSEAKT